MNLDDLPRVKLGFLPTPVERLDRLGAELGIRLSVKRDGFTGLAGCIAAGTIPRGSDVMFVHCGGSPALFPFAGVLTADRAGPAPGRAA